MNRKTLPLLNGFLPKAEKLFSDKKSALIALSGGPDSVCLFMLMLDYAKTHKITLYASHINHCIRGMDADSDESFVRELCKNYGVELFVKKADVPKIAAESGKSLEQAARDIRYEYFDLLCNEHNIDCVVTAHNLSDLCETALFNLARGSGLTGLKGISEIRGNVIRPLLDYTKAEITAYCDEYSIPYCIDKTNADTDYTRNHIRHNVIPSLYKINPEAQYAIKRFCDSVSEADEFIESEANKFIDLHAASGLFSKESFVKLPVVIKKRVISILFERIIGNNNSKMITSSHIDEAIEFINSAKSGKRIPFPGDISLLCEFDSFRFVFAALDKISASSKLVNGDNRFGDSVINVYDFKRNSEDSPEIIYTLFKQAFFDNDKIVGDVFVRTRQNGDAVFSDGITKRVKEYFINKKIPVSERDSYPVICDEAGIIWVPQMCVADRVKISDATENVKTIKIIKDEKNEI